MIRWENRIRLDRTASYTIKPNQPDRPGQIYTNRGAIGAITFTLPAPSLNLLNHFYEFEVQAAQSLIVAAATAGDLIAPGNTAADNVGFQVAGQKVGGKIIVICVSATKWFAAGYRAGGGFCVNGTEVAQTIGGTALTVTAAEVNVLHGVTPGTAAASSAVVLDAQTAIAGLLVALGGGATATKTGGNAASVTDPTSTASGAVQNTEYTLNSVTLPPAAFNANTRMAMIAAWGTTAANANAKNLKLIFGGTTIAVSTGTTANAKDFFALAFVLRTGASAQAVVSLLFVDTGVAPILAISITMTENDANAIIIALKSANTAAAAASATGKGMSVIFGN